MILIIDSLNKHLYPHILTDMYRLRARVFGDRLGWEVNLENGCEIDQFDALDPAYVVSLDNDGNVVGCVRALQTTGPHMLADVFQAILQGEPPLRAATLWESTRFCVDTQRLDFGKTGSSVSYVTCEVMIGSLEFARSAGVTDIVTVIDPVMNRVLKRSATAPYGYVGETTPMGKVKAMAALLDCTDERITDIRDYAGIPGDVFVSAERAFEIEERKKAKLRMLSTELGDYCEDQVANADTPRELAAAMMLVEMLGTQHGQDTTMTRVA